MNDIQKNESVDLNPGNQVEDHKNNLLSSGSPKGELQVKRESTVGAHVRKLTPFRMSSSGNTSKTVHDQYEEK